MYTIPRLTRFKKAAYRGDNSRGDLPRWHIAVQPYKKGELYRRYVALCGYEIESPYLKNVMLSVAKTVRGPHCTKCIKKAEEASDE